MTLTAAEHSRAHRDMKRTAGLCVQNGCWHKAAKGRTRCAPCLRKDSAAVADRRKQKTDAVSPTPAAPPKELASNGYAHSTTSRNRG